MGIFVRSFIPKKFQKMSQNDRLTRATSKASLDQGKSTSLLDTSIQKTDIDTSRAATGDFLSALNSTIDESQNEASHNGDEDGNDGGAIDGDGISGDEDDGNEEEQISSISFVWQDKSEMAKIPLQIHHLVNEPSSISIFKFLHSAIFDTVGKLSISRQEMEELLTNHCNVLMDIFLGFLCAEDPTILKTVNDPMKEYHNCTAFFDAATEELTLDARVHALLKFEKKINQNIKLTCLQINGALVAQKQAHLGWSRFQPLTSLTHPVSGVGSSTAFSSIGNSTPQIQFTSTNPETASLSFETALPQPPLVLTTVNSTNLGILMNSLSDSVGKIYPDKIVKATKKFICSLSWKTREELVKEATIFFNLTLPKECGGLTLEDGLMGQLNNCFRRDPVHIDEQSKSKIFDQWKSPLSASTIAEAVKEAWADISRDFPHRNRAIGFEKLSNEIFLYLDQEIHLKLLKRTVYQRSIFGLLTQVAGTIDTYSGTRVDGEHDEKLSTADLARLKYVLLKYQDTTSRAHALNQSHGPKVETNSGAILIAHKFFAGLSCATDLLSEFFNTLSSQQGEFYYFHLATYMRSISDIIVGNISIPVKRVYMLQTSQALDDISVIAGGTPSSFGQSVYQLNNVEKHAIGAPDSLARLLLAHISTQLQFRPEMTQAFKHLVNEKEISAFAQQGPVYDGSASAYLDKLITQLQHTKVESFVVPDSNGNSPAVLFPYPTLTKYTAHCVELRTNDLHTNFFAGKPIEKSAAKNLVKSKVSSASKSKAPDIKSTQQANEANVTAGYQAGVSRALQCLTAANGNAIVAATEFAKLVQKDVPAFTVQGTAKNPDALLHPLTLFTPLGTWSQPMAKGAFIAPAHFGQFIVLRELLGFKNKANKDRLLPPELKNIIPTLSVATISNNVTNK